MEMKPGARPHCGMKAVSAVAAIDRIGLLDGVERTMSSVLLSTRIER